MRNANVSAVVGLDATYGYKAVAKALTELHDYSPQSMRAAFLDLRRDWDDKAAALDLSSAHEFHYSDRTFITIKKMHHRDFVAVAMVAFQFHLPLAAGEEDNSGWSRETGARGYQDMCRIALDFFDQKLKGDAGAQERLMADLARVEGGLLTHENAVRHPPSAVDLSAVIAQQDFDAATAIVDQYHRENSGEIVLNEVTFNAFGSY